jgi:hypothetical protein
MELFSPPLAEGTEIQDSSEPRRIEATGNLVRLSPLWRVRWKGCIEGDSDKLTTSSDFGAHPIHRELVLASACEFAQNKFLRQAEDDVETHASRTFAVGHS